MAWAAVALSDGCARAAAAVVVVVVGVKEGGHSEVIPVHSEVI